WINLLTDSGPALALGIDPLDPAVMRRRPRSRQDRLIDRDMIVSIGIIGLTMAVATLAMLDAKLAGGLIEGSSDLDTARTAAFTVLVLAQLFNAFNTRSDHRSAFRLMTSNPWLLATIAFSLALQILVVHWSVLNEAFSTAPLSREDWLWSAILASSVLWVGELRKLMARTRTVSS
ncbi:MAG: cation-translocating P-type ATPase C-terminal domain-containing protein, partial [Acidimicrobiia bacterium]|nr:cation-translocating P-type ATPase C-terminal domain-containing protein [Acidimicrobiia bacterium]